MGIQWGYSLIRDITHFSEMKSLRTLISIGRKSSSSQTHRGQTRGQVVNISSFQAEPRVLRGACWKKWSSKTWRKDWDEDSGGVTSILRAVCCDNSRLSIDKTSQQKWEGGKCLVDRNIESRRCWSTYRGNSPFWNWACMSGDSAASCCWVAWS